MASPVTRKALASLRALQWNSYREWFRARKADGYCQVDKKLVDHPPRCWARARREPAMLGIRNGREPQLDNTRPRPDLTPTGDLCSTSSN